MKSSKDSQGKSLAQPQFDDVLKRMLASPPAPHVKKKPAAKPTQKKLPEADQGA